MSEQEETPDTTSEETTASAEEPLPKADVSVLLQISVAQYASLAWQKMGLQTDPFTHAIEKDIEQARLAIDVVEVLVEKLRPHVPGETMREMQSLLTNLRLNFIKQAGG